MVGFGELRKLSLKWHTDIPTVERVYSLDWLLKATFEQEILFQALTLRGPSALGKAYFPEYPPISDVEFACDANITSTSLEPELDTIAVQASRQSGLNFRLQSFHGTEARFEYDGPLGRRSAAQPRLPFRFFNSVLRAPRTEGRLIHPFLEPFDSLASAVALEEIAAHIISGFGGRPRARDVFDLWFILRHHFGRLDIRLTGFLLGEIAREKGRPASAELDPSQRALLQGAWDAALKEFPARPTFEEAVADIKIRLKEILK